MQNSASGSSGPVRRSRRRHSTFGVPLAAPSSKATRPNFIVRSATNAPPVLSTDYVVKNRLGEVSESTPLVLDRHFPPTAPLNGTNGNDSEMAATQILSEEPQEVLDIREQDVFEQVPNLFRLLDLVDEQGSGGIVEKTIIDQASLHRLLDAVQPGSYGSVSNINFKALDTLSIRATGLYGIRSEIVNYLSGAGCLSDNAVTLLSREATSTIASPPVLRSGLYLILRPEADSEGSNLKQAYIIYWPEDSTWDDQAASSSVRRNRITFMRYLTKLTEQLVALVSPDQAYNFVWDTTARNKDLPEGQAESDDDSRLFSFEVSKSLGQEEAATSSPGFIVHAEPTHLPKNVVGTETKLVAGEQKAALMVSVRESSWTDRTPFNENIEEVSLRDIIAGNPNRPQLQLGDLLVDDLLLLADNGLREKYPEPFRNYERCMRDLDTARSTQEIQGRETVNHNIQQDIPMIREGLRDYIRNIYIQLYPSLNTATNDITNDSEASALLHARYPALSGSEFDIQKTNKLNQIMDRRFQSLKSKWILIRDSLTAEPLLSEETQAEFVSNVLDGADGDPPRLPPQRSLLPKGTKRSFVNRFVFGPANSVVGFLIGESAGSDTTPKSMREHGPLTDPQFVSGLRPLQASFPVLEDVTRQIYDCLLAELSSFEERTAAAEVDKIVFMERERLTDLASRTCQDDFQRGKSRAFEELMTELREAMPNTALDIACVDSLKRSQRGHVESRCGPYRWRGTRIIHRGVQVRHCIYPLGLTEQDSQLCRSNEAHIPAPKLESRHKFEFTVDPDRKIEFLQLVRDKCLAVISEPGKSHIYIEDNLTLDQSINRKSGKVALIHHSLGGSRCLFAFDQTTRLLAIVHGEEEPKLSVYIFDEQFSRLRSRGSSISLKGWYDAEVRIEKACFVSGKEEVCLIEDTGRARVFSLITQQFRSATLQINAPIIDAFSALDGSCLFVTVADQEAQQPHERLLAFHWASFGSNHGGIHVTDLSPSDAARIVTRLEGRGRNHVLSFSFDTQSVNSVAVEVKQKATEFSIRSNDKRAQTTTVEAFNNSLIDCHLEVWTRFPVVPAVSRCTLVPVSRQPRKIVFQSLVPLPELGDYFARMISTFERTTRKPMDGSLSAISVVSSVDGEASLNDGVSEFLFGSFIVELLCLIPLHLALTRDNRFIPLKDGVWDPEYERSLLGADVPAIIDALSLGWYESLFQSYMATKPVRVVSSMGEQSVGKSYCLNHFADTTFAGSAMRTTEGVWLSCTPTESYLLVSLDFEGVHSIERSAQEDALLVLFNTAISNLVLFRNNFALSRDIAGLFTSFQSSAMVLDPNTNMGLFNSTLAIIIKDVTDSDSRDIVNEFHLKFLQIVEREKDQNFISRLHRGRIDIIPWPVINTPIFYTLFRRLRQNLERQQFTHGTGGAFLHSLKTLMAKIKAQDWGALDQNLATHRAQQLLERLPRALSDGYSEEGPLKNMDTDEELSPIAERLSFFVPKLTGGAESEVDEYIDRSLQGLVKAFGPAVGVRQHIQDRAYVETMQDLIHKSLDRRIDQIRNWITVNVSRFPQSNQDIRDLFGKFNNAALTMRAAARLCSSTCSNCQLQCLQPHRHVDETHHCGTNHRCAFSCAIAEEHPRREPCGLPAGHSGIHMCDVKMHLCGNDCHLYGKGGCARSCVKPLLHEGEHLCSARSHLCGKPCDLRNAGERGAYNCPETCNRLWDEPHAQHTCNNAQSCPLECALCRRLCCNTNHLHGLDPAAIHLCGQGHNCTFLCEANGICQIETRPSAIQQRFAGRHEAFQYTKYSQVDRRLSCVVPIPPGELTHTGPHTHSTEDDVFHFCDTRCPNCEYLCTLPLGHPQQLHETSHGSMTATKWVVEGSDANPIYELQGRKFGSGDEGAPMLCSLVCAAQGRHAHIDYCRDPSNCGEPECEHINERMHPQPDRAKDWISHSLSWARSGFKDPYSQDEQMEFSRCDVLCAGPEHEATTTTTANPSYCTLPIFHAPQAQQPAPTTGHISLDGHLFDCQNPFRLHQAYHIVFVIDSSSSMTLSDRKPLSNTPISGRLTASCNNRYGAVLSALYSFWLSRETAATSSSIQAREDAYSVITFDRHSTTRIANDFTSTADQLVNQLILQLTGWGTNFHGALLQTQSLIEAHWSSDRAPVVVFLSDGEGSIENNSVYDLCRTCVRLGKALAFYTVSFGSRTSPTSLRRMADIAHEVYASAPQDVFSAARGNPCAHTNAIDSIQLADTFLGIANSLQKPRASLIGDARARRATF